MTKKLFAIIATLAVSVIALFGCSGDHYNKVEISGVQSTEYTVEGNGSSAVQYGNYVYFLNGTRGYEDTEGTANVFGKVVKGAVYRAELLGENADGAFVVKRDTVTELGLKSHKDVDYKRDEVDVIDVQTVVPKTVGTASYKEGGIFIYDDCIYYASPNNLKNKTGDVQYKKTDFFRMTLDGKNTKKIYTTTADSDSSPYAFYSVGENVFLTVLDGTDLITVKIAKKNGKVEDKVKLAENVTDAVMPVKPVYYKGIDENTIYDFIYYKRSATDDDTLPNGEVMEYVRPDGETESYVFGADGYDSYTLETVRDGYLFYRKADNYTNKLFATNLHNALKANDEKYAASEKNADAENVDKPVLAVSDLDKLDVYPFVQNYEFGKANVTNVVSVVATTKSSGSSSDSSSKSSSDSSSTVTATLYVDGVAKGELASGAAVTVDAVYENYLFLTADSTLKQIDLSAGSFLTAVTVAENVTTGTFGASVAGGYLIYFGKVSDEANGYAFFKEIDGREGSSDAFFVGELTEDEDFSEIESLTVVTQPTKTSYKVGEKLDLTGLVVEANFYADSEGNKPEAKVIEVTDKMVKGFDSSAAGSVTVTVTYEKRTVDFTVTVVDDTKDTTDSTDKTTDKNADKTTDDTKSCSTIVPVGPWFFIGGGGLLVLAAGALFLGKRKATARA